MAVRVQTDRSSSVNDKYQLPVTRQQDFPQWYRTVLDVASLSESSAVRGCMVIKPLGYAIWEQIQRQLDDRFKEGKCCKNAYFPLFIPVEFFEKEATHVKGFAKECAVVTHSRMKVDEEGRMVSDPDSKLGRPLIVRPTSETIIGDSMRKWVHSHRDLPLLLNQWCNVVRWERHTRPFIRTSEFLWQEGHCAFATEKEGRENALKMAQVYRAFMTEVCALPVILGQKSPGERFAGAVQTYCLEAMMQDGKAVQAGTSHYLGQNFAKASDIRFKDSSNKLEYAHTTSWGVSTRLIGSLIMVHSDDYGLRVPPRLAAHHVVILPSQAPSELRDAYIEKIEKTLNRLIFEGRKLDVEVDRRDLNAGEKARDWLGKGMPIQLEIGPREAKSNTITMYRRDQDPSLKTVIAADTIAEQIIESLGEIQQNYYNQANAFLAEHIRTDIKTLEEITAFFAPAPWEKREKELEELEETGGVKNLSDVEEGKVEDSSGVMLQKWDPNKVGFVRAKWCGDPETEEMLKPLGVTIRCLPEDQSGTEGICVLTGRPATLEAIFGKSY